LEEERRVQRSKQRRPWYWAVEWEGEGHEVGHGILETQTQEESIAIIHNTTKSTSSEMSGKHASCTSRQRRGFICDCEESGLQCRVRRLSGHNECEQEYL
jgi:hypothetical protein